jgi:hypothetical protein
MRFIFLLILLPLFMGCTVTKVHEDFSIQPGSDEGMVVLSTRMTDRCSGFSGVGTFFYLGTAGGQTESGGFPLMISTTEYDFADPPGYFYARRMKAGEYRLTYVQKAVYGGLYQSRKPFDIPFHVVAGHVHYLGELEVEMPSCQSIVVRVRDQRERDAALFDKKMKYVKSDLFDYQILRVGHGPMPFAATGNKGNAGRSSSAPSTQVGATPPKFGKFSYVVEKMAKANGCQGSDGAYLTTEPGSVESYRVECDGGKAFAARCEYSVCKPDK